jgi:membrane fusion protein (multidrug efflux system)
VAVEAVTVTKGTISRNIEASGVVMGASEATVMSKTQGEITGVSFELGQKVNSGQVLVQVDDKIQEFEMQTALQELEITKRDLAIAEKLALDNAVSAAELDRKRTAFIAATTSYERAKKSYEDCAIKAPFSGYIASKDKSLSKGNYLNIGVPIARVVDLNMLRTEIAVSEREISQIKAGSPAVIKVSAGCKPGQWNGNVKAIAAGADPKTGSFTVIIEWKNRCYSQIKAGMSTAVIIGADGTEDAILVPTAAIIQRDGRNVVLTAVGDRVIVKPIRKGRVEGNRTQILEGISVGEVIIMSALGTLAPNNPVIISKIGESGTWK